MDHEWAIDVSQIVHLLRSSLDHIAWHLVAIGSKPPVTPQTAEKIQFPIYIDGQRFERACASTLIPGISTDALDIIRRYQPFTTGQNTLDPLWQLRELSNFHKHRSIHLTSTILQAIQMNIAAWFWDGKPPVPDLKTLKSGSLHLGPFKNGTLLGQMIVHSTNPFTVKDENDVTGDIAFDQAPACVNGRIVAPTIRAMGETAFNLSADICAEMGWSF